MNFKPKKFIYYKVMKTQNREKIGLNYLLNIEFNF